jgi:hypothetical protein
MRVLIGFVEVLGFAFFSVAIATAAEQPPEANPNVAKRGLVVVSAARQVLYVGDDLSTEIAEQRFGKQCLMLRCDAHELSLADEKKTSFRFRGQGNVTVSTPHYAARADSLNWSGEQILLQSAARATQWQGTNEAAKRSVRVECSMVECDWFSGKSVQIHDAQRGEIVPVVPLKP